MPRFDVTVTFFAVEAESADDAVFHVCRALEKACLYDNEPELHFDLLEDCVTDVTETTKDEHQERV